MGIDRVAPPAALICLLLGAGPVEGQPAPDQVVFSEVLADPLGRADLEFIELQNRGPEPADLLGWSFTDGIRFAFSRSTVIPPGGFLVVARKREALSTFFGLDPSLVAGDFGGALDNAGERVALVDGAGRLVEELTYGERFPFQGQGAGGFLSLQRHCLEVPADAPFNWKAGPPTPGKRTEVTQCPPRMAVQDPREFPIIVNEISYHPAGSPDLPHEYVELLNRGGEERDLSLWEFKKGIHFVFPAGTRLAPGGFLVVAENPAALASAYGLDAARVLGPFLDGTTLSNSGETLTLVDRSGTVQDQVTYAQDGAWPAFADGLGASLQRVDPLGPSDAPGNWRAAPPPTESAGEWRTFRMEGRHDGPRFYFYLLGEGTALIDGLSLTLKDGGQEFLANGDFQNGFTSWSGTGNHIDSSAQSDGGYGDNGPCAVVKATGAGNGFQHGIRQTLATLPGAQNVCVLTVHVKPLLGDGRFVARSSIATAQNGLLILQGDAGSGESGPGGTPLRANSVGTSSTPPTVTLRSTTPERPTSRDPVVITARVEAEDAVEATAIYQVGTGAPAQVPLADDGRAPDARAGDGTWSGVLPPAPDKSLVWISLRSRTRGGAVGVWPPTKNPASTTGYYVTDNLPVSNEEVRLYYLFTPGALNDLNCADGVYQKGSLVDYRGRAHREVGVKFRGETACGYPKRPMRVKFAKGDFLDGQEDLNFNAGWNDKSMLREKFGFDFFRDAGVAYSECHLARVHTNGGVFHGAYFTVEDPGEAYLRRNRRDPGGGLYKARSAMLSSDTSAYEPRTDAAPAITPAVRTFAADLNRLTGRALIDFLNLSLDVEAFIDYQAVQVIIIDGDSVVKNWLLYYGSHELSGSTAPLVSMFPWDIDLSYGQMLLTTDVRNYDIHPLFQTATYPFYDQGYHGIINAVLQKAPGDYYVKAYYGRMWRLLEEKFSPQVLFPKLDRFEALTGSTVLEDLKKWPRAWGAKGTDPVYWRKDHRTFIERRRDFLTAFLTSTKATTQGRTFRYTPAPRVKFTEIHVRPPVDQANLEFVELTSLEDQPVDLGGWDIPLLGFVFPAGTSLAAGGTLLLARDPAALRLAGTPEGALLLGPYPKSLPPKGGILRLRDSGEGGKYFPETIDVVVYDGDSTWPKGAGGTGKSLELASLASDNDDGTSWRAGWSPGRAAAENLPPRAAIEVSPSGGPAPLTALLSGLASDDPDRDELSYDWELPSGGRDARPALLYTFDRAGSYRVVLTARDPFGGESRVEVEVVVVVGGEPLFRRGDATEDGAVDLSDAVQVLSALFLGGPPPACPDSADVNDDQEVNITHPISLLSYLFVAGAAPAAPGPAACGADPTPDPLAPCAQPAAGCR